jgi:hypothetical protein
MSRAVTAHHWPSWAHGAIANKLRPPPAPFGRPGPVLRSTPRRRDAARSFRLTGSASGIGREPAVPPKLGLSEPHVAGVAGRLGF